MAARTMPTNGSVIRVVRTAYGLTLAELARGAEVSESYLSRLETGKLDGTAPALRRIADRLGVPLDALVRCKVTEPATEPQPVVDPAAA